MELLILPLGMFQQTSHQGLSQEHVLDHHSPYQYSPTGKNGDYDNHIKAQVTIAINKITVTTAYFLVDPSRVWVTEEGKRRQLDIQFGGSNDVDRRNSIRTLWVVPDGIGAVGTVVEEPGKCVVVHLKNTIYHRVAFHWKRTK